MSARSYHLARIFSVTGLLLVIYFALTRDAAHHDLSAVEAHNLWVIRDVEQLERGAPSNVTRTILANFRETLARTREDQLFLRFPYLIVLDYWTIALGGSIFSARILSVFLALLSVTIVYRAFARKGLAVPALVIILVITTNPLVSTPLREINAVGLWLLAVAIFAYVVSRHLPATQSTYRLSRVGLGAVGVIVVVQIFVLRGTTDEWRTVIEDLNEMRMPNEPAITDFDPRSAAAYYDLHHGLKRGIALELSWQTPDALKMLDYVAKLTRSPEPVWVMMLTGKYGESGWNVSYALTAAGRSPDVCLTVGDAVDDNWMIFARFVLSDSRSQSRNCAGYVP